MLNLNETMDSTKEENILTLKDGFGNTVLHKAVELNMKTTIKWCLLEAAQKYQVRPDFLLNISNSAYRRPAEMSCEVLLICEIEEY